MPLTVNGMTVEQIVEALKVPGRSAKKIAQETGIGVVIISRIKNGHVKLPRIETLDKLSRYIIDNPEEVEILRARLAGEGK